MNPALIVEFGYCCPKLLATGEWAALNQYIFTAGLLVGVDEDGYRTRFCYPTMAAAIDALAMWDGHGDPPGPWIKEKGRIERSNPNTSNFAGVRIVTERRA